MKRVMCTNLRTQDTKRFPNIESCARYFRETLGYKACRRTTINEINKRIENGDQLQGWVFDYDDE